MFDRYYCIFYLIPTKFKNQPNSKMLLKHENIYFLTPDFSKQNGIGCKLSMVIMLSQLHNRTLDDMQLYATCNALILHEERFFYNKQVKCFKIGISIIKMVICLGMYIEGYMVGIHILLLY